MEALLIEDIEEPDREDRLSALEAEVASLRNALALSGVCTDRNRVSLVVYSGTLDKLLAALNIATGAASMGCEVNLFFTFWATSAMRAGTPMKNKTAMERVLGLILPAGARELKLSTMNFGGLGTAMIKRRMKQKNIADLDKLFSMAEELGVKISICEMSMDLMGMTLDDLRRYPGMEVCGVGTFMAHALASKVTLFI
jgi:peroxiredoxin family protein